MKVTSLACIQGAWLPDTEPKLILDIGAGTGLLSLMRAQQNVGEIHAVEIEDHAFEQLVGNVKKSKWSDRIECYHEDVRDFAKENSRTYDLIITNPPFFQNQYKSDNQKVNTARHDSSLSMNDLLGAIIKLLDPQGVVSVLLPIEETRLFIDIATAEMLYPNKQLIIIDSPKKRPKAAVTFLSKKPGENKKTTIHIKNEQNELSSEYITLLRPYYLKI